MLVIVQQFNVDWFSLFSKRTSWELAITLMLASNRQQLMKEFLVRYSKTNADYMFIEGLLYYAYLGFIVIIIVPRLIKLIN